jgi:hypothetical protein
MKNALNLLSLRFHALQFTRLFWHSIPIVRLAYSRKYRLGLIWLAWAFYGTISDEAHAINYARCHSESPGSGALHPFYSFDPIGRAGLPMAGGLLRVPPRVRHLDAFLCRGAIGRPFHEHDARQLLAAGVPTLNVNWKSLCSHMRGISTLACRSSTCF